MRQGSPGGRRPRGGRHSGNGGNGGNGGGSPRGEGRAPRSAASLRHQTFDSNGPDVRVRGNAWQVCEKYQSLARDAQSSGDRVLAESYLQYAEHYYRLTEAINEATAAEQRQRGGPLPPFGAQPDVPSNYYSPDGQLLGAPPVSAPPSDGAGEADSQFKDPRPFPFPPAQADDTSVARRDPFLPTDEGDGTESGPQKFIAER